MTSHNHAAKGRVRIVQKSVTFLTVLLFSQFLLGYIHKWRQTSITLRKETHRHKVYNFFFSNFTKFIVKNLRCIRQGRRGRVLEGVEVPSCRSRWQDRSDRHQQGQVRRRGQGTHHPLQAYRRPQEGVPWIGKCSTIKLKVMVRDLVCLFYKFVKFHLFCPSVDSQPHSHLQLLFTSGVWLRCHLHGPHRHKRQLPRHC